MSETPRILLLHGNDEFAMSAHIEKVCADLGEPSTADMNIASFDGRLGLDFEALNAAVNAAPFLAPRRVMVLVHPNSAFSTPEARKKLLGLLDKAQPTTTIVLVEHDELKPDHWLLKWAGRAGGRTAVHIYNLPKRWEMPHWIESEAKKQAGRIEPDAAARLSEMVGEDTRMAAQELTKLLTYVNFERPVRLLDVEKVSIFSAQVSVFELVDALGQGDGRKAQKVLHQLLEEADPLEFWGMVIRQFRLLLQAREMLDEHATIPEIQKALGLHEYVAQKVCNQAGRFSMPVLESIYHKLLEIDEGAKTSQVPLDLALDTLIVELMQKQ
ncbi:MAG: DNA polymerase III subunit delta [Anaerolineales bacterium]|jgi:DNA polymerase-3 subunit delta